METNFFSQLFSRLGEIFAYCWQWLGDNQATAAQWYSGIIRWLMPVLALLILLSVLKSMFCVRNPKETWAYLVVDKALRFPITHWECIIGRARHCDVVINLPTVSRSQCALTRDDQGNWMVHNLSEKQATRVNDTEASTPLPISAGDTLSFGDTALHFELLSKEELRTQQFLRKAESKAIPPWHSLLLLTLFQLLTAIQLILVRPEYSRSILLSFAVVAGLMWSYTLMWRILGRKGFELETLAFFSCTMSLAITASSAPTALGKQTIAILLGVVAFLILGWWLRDLERSVKLRYPMAVATLFLLSLSLIFGAVTFGAQNWIQIAGVSIQPSEFAKISFIFAGAATMDRLFVKHNLWGFILFSVGCMGLLGLMSDFGAAAIFFIVFLVIAYLRSGDFATMSLIGAGAVLIVGLVLRFKPYIATRFATWGHVWEFANSGGYQQSRAMSAAASGGLIGVGAGNGWLREIAAADTDLVFAMLAEEWGLIIALLSVAIVITMATFSVRIIRNGRSAFYTIAACAAAALLVFQAALNVLGSVDILPLTGVTFPFVSNGGSSMISCWALLAFIKAADTRQGASFAVRSKPLICPRQDDIQKETEEVAIATESQAEGDEISSAFSHFSPENFSGPLLPDICWDEDASPQKAQKHTQVFRQARGQYTAPEEEDAE
ncbi:MAG: FtsW/RodA/SpoVE family cell cycle protein [Firmicutes bacterium]|nr:FtsW/RodA/SpoVE family cell cycle protein [Bacillota bacterium]